MRIIQRTSSKTTPVPESLNTKKGRSRVYSCAFCEFIKENFDQEGMEVSNNITEESDIMDRAFEAKYLYHLDTVHSLRK